MTAQNNELEIVRLLAEQGASISSRDHNRSTALHLATTTQKCSIVELLVHSGADVNAKRHDRRITLHTFMKVPQQELAVVGQWDKTDSIEKVIHVLVDNGASADESDTARWTTLHHTTAQKEQGAVRYLLSRGVDPNATKHGN